MKRLTMLVAVVTLISIVPVYYTSYAAQQKNAGKKQAQAVSKPAIKDIGSFKEVSSIIDSTHNKLLIFDMYAPWCGPCRMLAPIMESLAKQYGTKALFFRVNIDELPDVSSAFGVTGIPHVVFIKNKKAVAELTGLHDKSDYEQIITADSNGKKNKK
jgi:thioredoxin 1